MTEYISVYKNICIPCPYNPEHQLTNIKEILPHLEACRLVHIQSEAAEGREADIEARSFNPDHQIPELEFVLHSLICENASCCAQSEQKSSDQVNERVGQEKGSEQVEPDAASTNQVDEDEEGFLEGSELMEIFAEFERVKEVDISNYSYVDEIARFDEYIGLDL